VADQKKFWKKMGDDVYRNYTPFIPEKAAY